MARAFLLPNPSCYPICIQTFRVLKSELATLKPYNLGPIFTQSITGDPKGLVSGNLSYLCGIKVPASLADCA
jgi:hypothetical protein